MANIFSSAFNLQSTDQDDGYSELEALIGMRVASAEWPLFRADVPERLYSYFLAALPAHRRQHYNCQACRRFVERFGPLVKIRDDGSTVSLLWGPEGVPPFFTEAIRALRTLIESGRVVGVAVSSLGVWGRPRTGTWSHLSGSNPTVFKHALKNASQREAEIREDHGMLCCGLVDFPKVVVAEAVRVLEADAIYRAEKTLGIAKWLLAVHESVEGLGRAQRWNNVVWKAAATAPAGWCHVRSTMIGTLLEDIATGLSFEAVSRRWKDKMHPLQYQRPTAPVSAGQVAAAEKVIEQLKSSGALKRQFARLSDVTALWWPRTSWPEEPVLKTGVFQHLVTKPAVPKLELPLQVMTWEKFNRTVLPSAVGLECLVPPIGNFYGLITAEDHDAPAILQWDGLHGCSDDAAHRWPRNPVSWYFYHMGSAATRWGLIANAWCKVNAVFLKPCHWQRSDLFKHQGEGVFFALDGARDTQYRSGAVFFPECLKSDYHAVRHVIEAYARTAVASGKDEGDANGIALQKGSTEALTLRVTDVQGNQTVYKIDRWD